MNVDTIDHPEKARRVRAMFDSIAPRYDLLNHLLSVNIDKLWRARVVRELRPVLRQPGATALDVCCGTGDLAIALAAEAGPHAVTGLDFSAPMLRIATTKVASRVALLQADASAMPFSDQQFDAVTVAFGLRNLASPEKGLAEMYRVLKPGGRVAILEFSQPVVPVVRELFAFYFHHILPRVGGLISGSYGAYQYLPESVKHFPDQPSLEEAMNAAGFVDTSYRNLSFGIAALHQGKRAQLEGAA
jgi:demethylmenaquinone methyltransferase/2-methoxy-6-polyprenyl-1,4-benzoquinol methylase